MTEPTSFDFTSQAFSPETFQAVSFTGEEALSQPYEFNINLATESSFIDLEKVLNHPATFVIRQGGRELPYHGTVINIDQVNRVKEYTFYQAVLVPRLYRLTMIHHNQAFLEKTIPEILEAVLQDGGLTSFDYEFRLQGDQSIYRTREMVCQYNQSHFDFFSFWTESMGLYYFFEQGRDREKVIVTDTYLAHSPFRVEQDHAPEKEAGPHAPPPQRPKDECLMFYATPSGLGHAHSHESVFSFRRRQRLVPQTVKMKDYNYHKPSLDLSVEESVFPRRPPGEGRPPAHGGADRPRGHETQGNAFPETGQINIYGDPVHYGTLEEGRRLARIRAEEQRCRETIYTGVGRGAVLRPGFTFELTGHYQEDFNRKYMITQASHSGNQTGYLTAGLRKTVGDERGGPGNILTMTLKRIFVGREEKPTYENQFIAIPAEIQFRPERKTEPSRIWGTINAVVDGSQSGQYAEIDEQGRYKVILPFDSSGRKGLKASTWIRQAQPTGGGQQGMHFPLRPGTEVLLSFLAGDPNRPVIVGAVPNAENPNIVTSANSTQAGIQTAGGNQLVMNDQEGSESIGLYSPHHNSFIGIGGVGSGSILEATSSSSESFTVGDKMDFVLGAKSSVVGGQNLGIKIGADNSVLLGTKLDAKLASSISASFGNSINMNEGSSATIAQKKSLHGLDQVELTACPDVTNSTLWIAGIAALLVSLTASVTSVAGMWAGDNMVDGCLRQSEKTEKDKDGNDVELPASMLEYIGMGLGAGVDVVGTLAEMAIIITTANALADYMSGKNKVSRLKLNEDGIEMKVTKLTGKKDPKITIKAEGGNDVATITFGESGKNLVIEKKDAGKITLKDYLTLDKDESKIDLTGGKLVLKQGDSDNDESSLEINDKSLKMTVSSGPSLSLEKTSDSKTGKLAADDNNYIEITGGNDGKIVFKGPKIKDSKGKFKLNEDGTLQLG